MAKPETWRTERAAYPFGGVITTRFQDLDPLGHINNVAMAAIFENGRVRFNHSLGLKTRANAGERWLIASVALDYLAEAHFPDDIEIASGIGCVGRTSWSILSAAFQNGACVATSEAVLVLTGPDGAIALPDEYRSVFSANRAALPA